MSSPYPILDDKPIDKETLRVEMEEAGRSDDGIESSGQVAVTNPIATEETSELTFSASETTLAAAKTPPVAVDTETTQAASGTSTLASEATPDAIDTSAVVITEDDIAGNKDEKMGDDGNQTDIGPVAGLVQGGLVQGRIQEVNIKVETGATMVDENPVVQVTTVETSVTITQTFVSTVAAGGQNPYDSVSRKGTKDANIQLNDEGTEPQPNETQMPQSMNGKHDSSSADNQVSQVTISGFVVKSDCISTDSVSNNENFEIKGNIIADNVKIEHSVSKSEMLEPSSGNSGQVGDESHLTDVEEPLEKMAEDREIKITSNVDVGESEKLNLDRISGDDSMVEDEMDSNQKDSNTFGEVGDMAEKNETAKMEKPDDSVRDDSAAKKESVPGNKPISQKRKHLDVDKEEALNHEPAKRQRSSNRENTKAPETQVSKSTPVASLKEENKSAVQKHKSSFSSSSASDDGPKERLVPPSQKDPTNSLRIDRFLRPFTLKAVQELLGKTGIVDTFWMDQIKTHCYVAYSSVEEAIETRNAVYNLQWPLNGGRQLVAEFVDPDEVKSKLEAPPTPTTPAAPPPHQLHQKLPATSSLPPLINPSARECLPPPPPLFNPSARERLPPPPPLLNPSARERLPPLSKKQDVPVPTINDLFKKTKATPRIYYLPLSEEQVAAKLATGNGRAV